MYSNHIEKLMLVWMQGMMWLSIFPIKRPFAQLDQCWQEINTCVKNHKNQSTSNPKFDSRSPLFNQSDFLCCSLIQQAALTDKQCFCIMAPVISEDPSNDNMTSLLNGLIFCNATDSLLSLQSFCGVALTPPSPSSSINLLPSPPAPPNSIDLLPPPGKKKVIILAAVTSAILLVLITLGVSLYMMKARKKPHATDQSGIVTKNALLEESPHVLPSPPSHAPGEKDDSIKPESLEYEFEVLKVVTNNFSDDHKIGQGGFGAVYKGTFPNGEAVAIKRLAKGSWQGDKEFENEVTLVARLQHKNLVRLVGFCLAKEERLLVYEFMQNKSLDYFLFDPEKQQELNWSRRYNIIRGIARGMLYLHEDSPTRIIHRDLKAANVLLDAEMKPKIADFGMAKIFHVEQTQGDTSKIIGTHGYMAPEYMLHGHCSVLSDVYSFGVLVLEIVSGKRVTSSMHQFGSAHESLLSYAWRYFKDGRLLEFTDSTLLRDSYSKTEIIRCVHLGLLCVQEDMRRRPTMGKVVLMFESDNFDVGALWLPQHPGILPTRYAEQSTTSTTS